MNFFLESIQSTVNILFLIVVLGTLGISWIYADRLRKKHNADFPWSKSLAIVGVEILIWIAFNIFFEIFQRHWFWITVIGIIVIIFILRPKKRRYR